MPRMELIAGDARDILVVLGPPRSASRRRGSDSAPTCRWAARSTRPGWTCSPRRPGRPHRGDAGRLHRRPARARRRRTRATLTIERVDPAWITAVAGLPETSIDAHRRAAGSTASRRRSADLPREEKPWIRELAGQVVVVLPGRRPRRRTSSSSGPCGDRAEPPADGYERSLRRQSVSCGTPGPASTPRATSTTSTAFRAGGVRMRDDEIDGGRRRARAVAPPPPVPLRHRHAVVGAPRRPSPGADFSPAAIRLATRARRGPRVRGRPLRRVEPVRPAGQPRRDLRRRVHVAWRAWLAARTSGRGPGSSPTSSRPGGDLLHHRGPPGRPGLRERGRRARRAAARLPVLGAPRPARRSRRRLVRRPGRRRRRGAPSTAGTTASARSSRRSSTPASCSRGCVEHPTSTGRPTSSSRPSRAAAWVLPRRHDGRAAADVLAAGARRPRLSREPGLEAERRPGRTARRLDELDEDAVARPRVDERDRALRPRDAAPCR